jgi:hypothetical protein
MIRAIKITGMAGFCAMLIGLDVCIAYPADDAQSNSSQPSGAMKPGRIDASHPLKIGAQYYPIESKRRGESGWCLIRFQVDVELTRFSGHPTVRFGGVQDGKQDDNPVHTGV